ncbi:MAG: aminotransferase class I/II-fold pyridoxal phosphate-dependent enzyme [Gemmatimonadota bacterium]
MERWQSRYENTVRCNLSDSGVQPFTLAEFRAFADVDPAAVEFGYGSTEGTAELRELIAALYPGAGPDSVVVTTGSAEANFLTLWRLVEPGDRVVIVEPTYGQTPGLARGLGADVVALDLEEARGWQPAPGAAADVITPGTRLVVVTNPNNPTGAVLSDEARAEIVAAAEAAGAWILADEVYAGAEVGPGDAAATPSLWGDTDRVIATASLSKAYGLQGLRLGWLVAPPALREDLWARKDYTSIAPAVLSDFLARAALEPETRRRIFDRCRNIIRSNLELLRGWADGMPGLRARLPDAGAICLFAYDAPIPCLELAERLRVEDSVLIVPGAHFGRESTFRVGFGYDAAKLPEGLAAVAAQLSGKRGTAGRDTAATAS